MSSVSLAPDLTAAVALSALSLSLVSLFSPSLSLSLDLSVDIISLAVAVEFLSLSPFLPGFSLALRRLLLLLRRRGAGAPLDLTGSEC